MTRPAASYRVPTATSLVTIEYPGPVSSSSSSIDEAVATLGGLHRLSRALASSSKIPNAATSNNPDDAAAAAGGIGGAGSGADAGVVELNFRPEHPFSHATPGETVPANNWLVVKVTKRKRRKRPGVEVEKEDGASTGVFKVEPVGSVSKVVRFRGASNQIVRDIYTDLVMKSAAMADIQYCPEGAEQDPTVQLATAMRTLDGKLTLLLLNISYESFVLHSAVEALQKYRFPEPNEDFEMGHDLKLLPPPVFSRLGLPQVYAWVTSSFYLSLSIWAQDLTSYRYRKNPLSAPVTTTLPDGSEVTRLVNKNKYRGELITSVPFDTPTADVRLLLLLSSHQITVEDVLIT
jgi:hypothetical protein